MKINKCENCNCGCHCSLQEHSDMYGVCSCTVCACKKQSIHELAKANPNKNYRELEIEMNSVVIDDTDDCESCQ